MARDRRPRSEPWTLSETESAERCGATSSSRCTAQTRGASARGRDAAAQPATRVDPELEGWQLSAHYEPAAGGRVGGDWYDAFVLRDGRLIVLLGDVAGHGIAAAGTMAQLRNVLRAQLFTRRRPRPRR